MFGNDCYAKEHTSITDEDFSHCDIIVVVSEKEQKDFMMKNYETVFILNPALSEEQVQKSVDKYEKYLKSNGAKMISKEIWGLKKLAYTIENKNSGFYNLLEYTAPAEVVPSLELDFTRDETVMRYLTVTLDKHAIAWAEKRRNRDTKKVSSKKISSKKAS
jgi:small subunit ribosomal protein S6